MGIAYTISWPDLPEHIRSDIIYKTFDLVHTSNEQNIINLNKFLKQYHAMYYLDNTIVFEDEKYYHWFLLKWQ